MAITSTPEHPALFTLGPDAAPSISGLAHVSADPAVSDAALTSDGYTWLAAILPAPTPPVCAACRHPTVLPPTAPVLWTCPRCHPQEAR
ncbi:hypothetical protein ACQP2T_13415 [Nonomuraea sp. CA-143628]|uniref:hypothetical protein n=1 Tax=Nonomuraea sp. CA-143628 TaxID=3239997 RepID=UPI003D93B92E